MFYRLFTLFEDECHKLDLEMATLTSPQTSDTTSYTTHSNLVHQERKLLDDMATVEGEIQWLDQTLSLLALRSTDPSNDAAFLAVAKVSEERKKKKKGIVC